MANPENLKNGEPYRFKSGDQAAKAGAKGGVASGIAKRKKRDMADTIKLLMNMPVSANQKKLKEAMTRFGIPENEQTQRAAAAFNMMLEVSKGNVQAFRALNEVEERREDSKFRNKQFNYQKQRDREMAQAEAGQSSLADRIISAYAQHEEPEEPEEQEDKPGSSDAGAPGPEAATEDGGGDDEHSE